ncbi:hypothetical protein VaNZ11_012543 [Volvox africanus]|uniref:Autophagy-related protein 14 n=1 Tax=Volvox africanus TaxID=51714 RepID=A0ABQ5SEV3_9CHLO|nr:hypothetical protein VaNZ11_012543 [Volvox africanus]
MVSQGVSCSVCDSANRTALVCPSCINNTLLFERRKMLLELSERRALLLQKLTGSIAHRQAHVDLEVRRQHLVTAAGREHERVRRAAAAVEEAKRHAALLRASNIGRRSSLERATAELSGRRAEHLAHHPTLLRYQALTHSHVAAMLLAEQRSKLAVLLDTLPLRVAAIRSAPGGQGQGAGPGVGRPTAAQSGLAGDASGAGGGGTSVAATAGGITGTGCGGGSGVGNGGGIAAGSSPIQVTLCNLKLPDSASVAPLMVSQPESTSAAVGYLLLLAELLSTYLGGPLLHEGSFQGSTSVVWQQHSFWNRRPSSSNARVPLFLEEGAGGGPALSNPFPGLAARVRGPPWASSQPGGQPRPGPPHQQQQQQSLHHQLMQGYSHLTRAMSGGMSGGGGGGGGGASGGNGASYTPHVDEALVRQRHTDLRLAYDMLLRSLACFSRDKILPLCLQLPPGWGTLGWLVVLCASVRRDPGTEAVLVAAQQALLAGHGSGDLRVGGFTGDGEGACAQDNDDDDPVEVEEDGWDVVQAPFLPPPPSQPDEVEHWTRAMFTDANAVQLQGGIGAGGGVGTNTLGQIRRPGFGALALALGQNGPPAMSLERVRSIFSK